MDRQDIIMSYTIPPAAEDLDSMARTILESLPEELLGFCEGLGIQIEESADDALQSELDLDDAYDLLALFRSGRQISPGVESKVANDEDVLIIFRRPLLDMWCESGEDLNVLMRQTIIEELGQNFDFSEDEIDEMTRRHYQGML